MSISRRKALGTLAAAGAGAVLPKRLRAESDRVRSSEGAGEAPPDTVAVLYDPTRCVGCRECILGCAEANGCDPAVATDEDPELTPRALTVLQRHSCEADDTFCKVQCMHCVDPACVSACMLGAMHKDEDGAVVWNADLCVGCRYCEIACPFNVPRFEWDDPAPELKKCELCPERRSRGLPPACVERCRRGALVFGTRKEMLAEAHRRIDENPGRYNPKVYGERDGGGTSVLYLAAAGVSFAEMGLPELGSESVPSLPESIQHTLYKGFVAPVVLFGLFGVLVRRNARHLHENGSDAGDSGKGSDRGGGDSSNPGDPPAPDPGPEAATTLPEGSGAGDGGGPNPGHAPGANPGPPSDRPAPVTEVDASAGTDLPAETEADAPPEAGATAGSDAATQAGRDPVPEAGSHAEEGSEPVGGKILTWPFAGLLAIFLIGVAAVTWRFIAGLGPTTNLNDGYAMGLWIAFDVVTGTALACGGYAVAILVYLANRGKYHPLVRAALVTSALGYTLGGLSVLIDIGRAWNFYKIPLYFWEWNVNSILLEVALCIMLYTLVLWIELSPAFLERWRESGVEGLRRVALWASPKLERAMPYLIALGLLLPTMHQSSLGSLMLLAGDKLHPLWHTPLLPALFLVSCLAMGYAAVTLECCISARVFDRPRETPMLRALAGPMALVLLGYAALRIVDISAAGKIELVTRMDGYSLLFLLEMALFVVPALALVLRRRSAGAVYLSAMGALVVAGGALYRFSTYLIAFNPGEQWHYFPAVPEFAVTFGIIAAEIMGYLIIVKKFPILRGAPRGARSGESRDGEGTETAPSGGGHERRSPVLTGAAGAAGAAVLLALLALPGTLEAQQREPATGEDLRCLTADPATCLEEPVSPDEPHEAICSTCHDLWEQERLSEAARSCTGSGCHLRPDTLTPFHRGLHAGVLENCTGCHRPHDARIPGGFENCTFCHEAGGAWARSQPRPERVAGAEEPERPHVPPAVTFRHSTHGRIECTTCHAAGERHREFRVTELGDCRSCHHRPPVARNCLACHSDDDARTITREVTRTLDIRIGSLDGPERIVPFDHALHGGVSCRTCHTEGLALGVSGSACARCHEEHHRATSRCIACHAEPAVGAHEREVHTGCGGTGCHVDAPAALTPMPRTREVCLVCHRGLRHHEPGNDCSSCHVLPPPRGS